MEINELLHQGHAEKGIAHKGETEEQRGGMHCPTPHSQEVPEPGFNSVWSDCKTCAIAARF